MAKHTPIFTLLETKNLAETLAREMQCGDIVTLSGDLGTGKTTFAQFFIRSLSNNDFLEVTSPTFTILQTYPIHLGNETRCELYHYDLYRIEHPNALRELGFEEAVSQVTLIEWPERASSLNLPVTLAITFELQKDGTRTVTLDGLSSRWKKKLNT